ncbi:MAG: sulfotransferase domain-containing protein, partial [Candidatus Limnocylindrales bacterium]
FPRDQVIILLYEECVADPRRQLRRTFEFLGLDPAAADRIDVHRRVNESRTAKVVLSREQRAALARAYAVENARLADAVPELDLSRWTTAT